MTNAAALQRTTSPFVAGVEEYLEAAGGPEWLATRRREAAKAFRTIGIPTTKAEAWKYTNLEPLARTAFQRPKDTTVREADVARHDLDGTFRVVLVDGRWDESVGRLDDLPDGVTIASLARILEQEPERVEDVLGTLAVADDDPFLPLNTATFTDGVLIDVAKGTVLERPIHVVHASTGGGTASHPRILVRAGLSSQLTFIQTHVATGDGAYFANPVTEVDVGENATVEHYKIQREHEDAFHFHGLGVRQGRASVYRHHNTDLGGGLVRNTVNQSFDGEGAECHLDGLFMVHGTQHVDNHTSVDHRVPHCTSREFYKGVLDGKARGVFFGKVFVRPDAQKTDADQHNPNLILSKGALVDSTPALEIHADDVKASHGSTIGQIARDQLFYLRSRGVRESTARSLLTYAFAAEAIRRARLDTVRSALKALVLDRLPDGQAVREAIHGLDA